MFDTSFPVCACFVVVVVAVVFLLVFFFLEVEHSSHTLIPLFMSGSVHSGSASRDDWPNVPREVACELDCGIVSPPRLRWVDGVSVLSVTCHPQFWQNDRGFFTCHCGNTGVE